MSGCDLEPQLWLAAKVLMTSVLGGTVALFGVFGNVSTALVMSQPTMRTPNNVLLLALAIYDTCLLLTAFLLYAVEYIVQFTQNHTLHQCWLSYVRVVFAVSHISQTGSVYMTVAASIERLVAVCLSQQSSHHCKPRGALLAIVCISLFAAIFNCTKYFEVLVVRNEPCPSDSWHGYKLQPSALAMDPLYQTAFTLWASNIVIVFLPFLLLIVANTIIVRNIRMSAKRCKPSMTRKHALTDDPSDTIQGLDFEALRFRKRSRSWSEREHLKQQSREATVILFVMVCLFLVCNLWGVVLTVLERLVGAGTLFQHHRPFYEFSRELINLMAIVNSSANFIIYCAFGKDFRQQLRNLYSQIGCHSARVNLHQTAPDLDLDVFASENPLTEDQTPRHQTSGLDSNRNQEKAMSCEGQSHGTYMNPETDPLHMQMQDTESLAASTHSMSPPAYDNLTATGSKAASDCDMDRPHTPITSHSSSSLLSELHQTIIYV